MNFLARAADHRFVRHSWTSHSDIWLLLGTDVLFIRVSTLPILQVDDASVE